MEFNNESLKNKSVQELIEIYKELSKYREVVGSFDPEFVFTLVDKLLEDYEILKRDFEIIDHEESRLDSANNKLIFENKKLVTTLEDYRKRLGEDIKYRDNN